MYLYSSFDGNTEENNQKVDKDIAKSRQLNLKTGNSQSSQIPQTEFEENTYLENTPLLKINPVSLGQDSV